MSESESVVTPEHLAAEPADSLVRRRAACDLAASFLVEASAGCGKTTVLVARVVELIAIGGARMDQLVVLTFTDKAAAELRARIRLGLHARMQETGAGGAGGAALAATALRDLELGFVGTLHAFCADLLRRFALDAQLSPLFQVADERVQRQLYREQFEHFWRNAVTRPPPGIARVLRRRGRDHEDRQGAKNAIFEAGLRLVAERDGAGPWRRPNVDRAAVLRPLLEQLAELAAWAPRALHPEDILAKAMQHVYCTASR
jgi:ATP-dependent helicase/nuclease subunit A